MTYADTTHRYGAPLTVGQRVHVVSAFGAGLPMLDHTGRPAVWTVDNIRDYHPHIRIAPTQPRQQTDFLDDPDGPWINGHHLIPAPDVTGDPDGRWTHLVVTYGRRRPDTEPSGTYGVWLRGERLLLMTDAHGTAVRDEPCALDRHALDRLYEWGRILTVEYRDGEYSGLPVG